MPLWQPSSGSFHLCDAAEEKPGRTAGKHKHAPMVKFNNVPAAEGDGSCSHNPLLSEHV